MPRKDLESYSAKVGYRKHPGMVMWIFHRVSGVVIGLFLIFHMLGISGICPFMGEFVKATPVLDIVAALFVFHVANGIRIIVMEFVSEKTRQGIAGTLIVVGVCLVMLAIRLAASIGTGA
ncbi:MAG: succinate dehydrogenase [Deferribacteraceae bacterium]|jgi:succinate dehydrogenase / fumarate reductase cytochrome b subunit|nr:succinate dehydrogenase [Deferribacteraceae bacterium]